VYALFEFIFVSVTVLPGEAFACATLFVSVPANVIAPAKVAALLAYKVKQLH
jgi:hypothetical protein